MKVLQYITCVILVLAFTNCKNEAKPEIKTVNTGTETTKTPDDPNATYAKAEFTIEGMTCAIGCAKTIEKNISKMDGVKSASVDFDKKLAMVEYNIDKVTPNTLEQTVTKTGEVYKVTDMKVVTGFSTKKACKSDCTQACCAKKTDEEKKACAADCKKACCAKETQA